MIPEKENTIAIISTGISLSPKTINAMIPTIKGLVPRIIV